MSNRPTPNIDKLCLATGAEVRFERMNTDDAHHGYFYWLENGGRSTPRLASLNALERRVGIDYEKFLDLLGGAR